ncbi:MAG: hypothetical protein CMJ20_00435 [Phycisphaeraceae bacterium]|nr:hypothetical protein [Phycisphaeraceae bacterium]
MMFPKAGCRGLADKAIALVLGHNPISTPADTWLHQSAVVSTQIVPRGTDLPSKQFVLRGTALLPWHHFGPSCIQTATRYKVQSIESLITIL